ncbi:hypothetical protein SAMN05421771_2158 [Granulicella pectinivorans]|uniref:NHL repeat containing protein n=1 Tax=Granulicella pectinivorans TaxID=474950 RepID=A0A1I6MA46_9BACT|nr:hypothetical protein [Granulicella pectinivorans]SFS12585.1 hypothetical protein SAMN05421771_2158 [Granulicella pectinivorans]
MRRFNFLFALQYAILGLCSLSTLFLAGCAGVTGTAVPSSLETSIPAGSVHGGQQPIQGAHVYLMAANTTGTYGSASTSLLHSGDPGTANDSIGTYVTTNSSGGFNYAGTATCPTPSTQVYLLAMGGNPTGLQGGPNNSASVLTAALGSCSTINSATFTSMNEVTTVAMAFALNQFMVDGTHVGAPASNVTGLKRAFATVANLVNSSTGAALAVTPGGNAVAPQATLNTLANIIAPCVNSGGSASSACSTLFSQTSTASGTPTTVLGAALNIAAFPGSQTAALYSDAAATAPFQPTLGAAPNDFSLGITYSPSIGVAQPSAVVIDASGNLWMANCQSCVTPTATDSIVEYGPDGTFLHSYSNAGIHNTKGLAIDAASSYLYSLNQAVAGSTHTLDQLTKMSLATGAVQSGFPVTFASGTYGTNTFNGIAVDNSGEIWATAAAAGAIVELNPGGNVINGGPYYIGGTYGVAVDNIGNIWFAGSGGNNLLQFDTNGDFLNNFTPAGLNQPQGIAINSSNEIWMPNVASNSLSKIEFFNGSNGSGSPYTSLGLFKPTVIAIDGTNQVVIPNCRVGCAGSGSTLPDSVLRLSQGGASNTGGSGSSAGAQNAGFSGVNGAAIDVSGNVWVTNSVTGKLTEIVSFAAPTIQPIAAASSAGTLGQLP